MENESTLGWDLLKESVRLKDAIAGIPIRQSVEASDPDTLLAGQQG